MDRDSGFCGGVIQAIETAERLLDKNSSVFSLGAIVHNEPELARLEAKGLGIIKSSELAELALAATPRAGRPNDKTGDKNAAEKSWAGKGDADLENQNSEQRNNRTLLIRAHGEPPSTYETARAAGFHVVDCTCPVVLKLQKEIKEAADRRHNDPRGGSVVIFGKQGHPEVLGLLGQAGDGAVVVEDLDMLRKAVQEGQIDLRRPVEIFSQTTRSPSEYSAICSRLEEKMADANGLSIAQFREQGLLLVHNTICTQVSSRYSSLPKFAASHDIIIFVAGQSSSNGKVLCDLCKAANSRTHLISSADELRPEWFDEADSVGVCGATSTPRWLLESVAEAIRSIFKK